MSDEIVQRISMIQRAVTKKAQDKYLAEVKQAKDQLIRTIRMFQLTDLGYTERQVWEKALDELVQQAANSCLPKIKQEGAEAFLKQFETLIVSIPELQEIAYQEGANSQG